MLEYINDVSAAPKAIGPYSQAVKLGDLAFLSGQIPINPETGKIEKEDVEGQTVQVMKNLQAVLSHLGADFSKVVKTTIFLKDLGDFQTVNQIYAEAMGEAKPARATVQVAELPLGSKVEIDAIVSLD